MMMKTSKNSAHLPTEEQVKKFDLLYSLLNSITKDMKEFSKKNPNEALNKLKVVLINRVLIQIEETLSLEPTVSFLELLDEETLPTNSDAVLIIGQFSSAMEQFKSKFYGWDNSERIARWFTKESPGKMHMGIRVHKIK